MFVGGTDGIVQFLFLFFFDFFAFALELLQLDFDERAGGGVAAHHGEARRGPGKHEARIVGFAAHGVVSGAKTSAANHGDFRNNAVRHGVYHFRPGANDAAPFGVFANHEAVDVMEKNQRDAILVAVENKARGFFRGFGVNHAAKFHALLVRAARKRLHVFLLIRDDSNGPASDARIAAEQRFAAFGAVFLEFAGIHDAGDDFAHVVLLAGIARKDSVDFFRRKERFARLGMTERRRIWRADFVNQSANSCDARVVIRFPKIHGAADLRVHFRSAEIFSGSFLADRGLHQRGSRKK